METKNNGMEHGLEHGMEQGEKQAKPIRGKADVVKITEEEVEECDEDEINVIDNDNEMIKILLKKECNGNGRSNENNASETGNALEQDEQKSQEGADLLSDISKRPLEWFKNLKELPDGVAEIYYKDITRRWMDSEKRIKAAEDLLISIKYEDRSLEEDRVEIMSELLDKAVQSFEIYEEHQSHRVPIGHRIVLEVQLLTVINNTVDRICNIVKDFDKLKDDQVGVNDERDQLRYEIRYCDAVYTEVHERFLKSYLEMDW